MTFFNGEKKLENLRVNVDGWTMYQTDKTIVFLKGYMRIVQTLTRGNICEFQHDRLFLKNKRSIDLPTLFQYADEIYNELLRVHSGCWVYKDYALNLDQYEKVSIDHETKGRFNIKFASIDDAKLYIDKVIEKCLTES